MGLGSLVSTGVDHKRIRISTGIGGTSGYVDARPYRHVYACMYACMHACVQLAYNRQCVSWSVRG